MQILKSKQKLINRLRPYERTIFKTFFNLKVFIIAKKTVYI